MSLRFSDLGVRMQVGSIVLVALACLGSMAGVYFDGKTRQDAVMAEAEAARGIFDRANTLENDLLQMRRSEKNFILRADAKYVEEHRQLRAHADENLTALKRDLAGGRSADIAPRVTQVAAGVVAYGQAFDTLVAEREKLGLDPDSGLEGRLRKSAHDLETEVNAFDDPKTSVILLQMRRHEKDYMLRHNLKYVEDFKGRVKDFTDRLMGLDLPLMTRTGISEAVAAYQRDFLTWADTDQRMARAEKTMQSVHRGMEPILDEVEQVVGKLVAVTRAEAEAVTAATERRLIWAFGVIVVLLAGLSVLIGRAISRPISAMTDAMGRLAGGDLGVRVPAGDLTNEIGRMAKAVEIFRDNARERARLEAAQAGEKQRQEAERRRMMIELADTFENRVGGVVSMVSSAASELEAAARTLSASSEETSAQSAAVAAASEEATANVQSVAAATEELSATVNEVGRQVEKSASITSRAMSEATGTTEQVRGLSDAAVHIGTIVQLISEIAAKTNLLALNATIEAARAGEAGRGFAVVAAEVKGLADQTARATADISTQVSAIQSSTHQAAGAISSIGDTIGEMNSIAGAIAAAVEEQGATTLEISRNLQEAAHGTADVATNITGVNLATADSSAASSQVLASASDLARQAETLRSVVSGFLSEVRAA